MSFQGIAFLPSGANFTLNLLKIAVKVKTSGPPHDIKLWLGVNKGMLPVKLSLQQIFLCQLNFF